MLASDEMLTDPPATTAIESRIGDAIEVALRDTGYAQLRDLNVRVDGHDVILLGRLPSYYLKQIAHHVVMAVPGVHSIKDAIDVVN